MSKEKRKQIILIIIAFGFMGIGYFNFFTQHKSIEVSASDVRNELTLGDVQLVNSEVFNENLNSKTNLVQNENQEFLSEIVSNDDLKSFENQDVEQKNSDDENIETENQDEYFVETRLERNKMYSQMLETYQKMLEKPEVGETQKAIATQEISNINNIKNGTMIAENLIKNKGFEDVVILVNNNTANVIVKTSLLNQEQIAKIQNIVSRELKIDLQNINISKK